MRRFVSAILLFAIVFPCLLLAQTAVIDKVWFEHNVTLNGVKGMKIFTSFHVNNAAGRTMDISVNHYFVYMTSDGPVRGRTTGQWVQGSDGQPQASAWNRFNFDARWNPTYMNDSWVFAPYGDMMTVPAEFDLAVWSFIYDNGRGQFIQESAKKTPFTFCVNTSRDYNPNARSNVQTPLPTTVPPTSSSDKLPLSSKCSVCYGLGKCSTCNGSGMSPNTSRPAKCGACGGTGWCRSCGGKGHQ